MKHTIKLPVMKRIIPVIILFSLIYSSCKKDHSKETKPDGKQYALTFRVKGFSQTDTIFETSKQTTNSVKALDVPVSPSIIDVLYCKVYDSSGKVVVFTQQVSTQPNFGTITNNLAPGNYTVVFAGGKNGLYILKDASATVSSLSTDILAFNAVNISGGERDNTIKDTFYKKISVTVGAGDVFQDITLDRIVAQLAITIQDKLPATVKYITLVIEPWVNALPVNGGNAYFNKGISYLPGLTTTIPADKLSTSNFTVYALVFNRSAPFKVTLLAQQTATSVHFGNTGFTEPWSDVWAKTIAGKVIPNVTVSANKTTVITGKLFGGSGTTDTTGFHISIDPDWNPTPVTIPF